MYIKYTHHALMPIILQKHYHLPVLDKEEREYHHYSSLINHVYDKDALAIVSPKTKLISSGFMLFVLTYTSIFISKMYA